MTDHLDALEKLGRLRDQNILTQAEFEAEKARLLDSVSPSHIRSGAGPAPDAASRDEARRHRPWLVPGTAAVMLALAVGAYFGIDSTASADPNPEPPNIPAEPAQPRLSAMLPFEVPTECLPSRGLRTVIDELRTLEPGKTQAAMRIGDGTAAVVPVVQRAGGEAIVAELTVPGSWDGLNVVGVRATRFEGSEIHSLQIQFREVADKVRRVLNAQGFELPAVGQLRTRDLEGGVGLVYGVEPIAGGSALTCARGVAAQPT